MTERLVSDTGVSNSDKITSNDTLTGTGDPNAVVHFTVDQVAIIATATADGNGNWTFAPSGLSDGPHTVVASETDGAGNTGSAALTFTLDTTAPTVTGVSDNPANGDLDAGKTVILTVGFSEKVRVSGGTPSLALNDGGKATYTGGSNTNALTFRYTVAAGQNINDLAVNGLVLNGATISDAAGNNAVLSGAATNLAGTLQIDTTAPTIASITASGTGISAGNGDLDAGKTVMLAVDFSENVIVSGTPTLKLNDGGTATYTGGSGTGELTFAYTVAAGQNTPDLAVNRLDLNGGSIEDAAGNDAVLSGAALNPPGVLQIDTTAPTVTNVVTSPSSGEVTTGHLVQITLDTSEAVNVLGTPQLLLNDGATAGYDAALSSAKALVFDYAVGTHEVTRNLAISGVELSSSTAITDAAGNAAMLSGAGADDLDLSINSWGHGNAGPGVGDFTIGGNAALELFGPSTADLLFAPGSGGLLKLDNSARFYGTVSGLAPGNSLDLGDIAYQGSATPGYTPIGSSAGILTVSEGNHAANVLLLGNYAAGSFVASNDGHGGTLITDPGQQAASHLHA